MENIKELYILGQPIETKIGSLHFIKVKDYPSIIEHIPYLNLQKFEVINTLKSIDETIASQLDDLPFISLIKELSSVFEFHFKLKELFRNCFRENVFDKIETDEEFEYYRNLICEMNCITFEKKNPNPEIERFNQLKKIYQKKKYNSDVSFESIVTSVWASTGFDVFNLTIYQLYSLFNRISQFKNYDTTVLYNSVSGTVPIEAWYKHVDVIKSDSDEKMSLDEFTKFASDILST